MTTTSWACRSTPDNSFKPKPASGRRLIARLRLYSHPVAALLRVGLIQALGGSMKFADGTEIKPGDIIQIDTVHRGRVVASIDTNEYLPGEDGWAYLKTGIMVDTDFGGLVHYTSETADDFVLIQHGAAA